MISQTVALFLYSLMYFSCSLNEQICWPTNFNNISRLGSATCRRPLPVIVGCFIFTSLGCLGLPFLRMENNAVKLWIPQVSYCCPLTPLIIIFWQESDFSLNYNWLWSSFPPEFRQHSVIIHGDDVLTPEAIQKVCKDQSVQLNIFKAHGLIKSHTAVGSWWRDNKCIL